MDTPSAKHHRGPGHPSGDLLADPLPAKTPSYPSIVVARWGPRIGLCLGLCSLLGVGFTVTGYVFETRAHAQETAASQAATLEKAKGDCAANLQSAVGATQARLTLLDGRVTRLEESGRWQLWLLQQLAARQGLPSSVPPSLLPSPGAPEPAMVGPVQPR